MPHGNSPQDTQNQPLKSSSGNDGDQQRTPKATPQSPAPSFAQAISSPGPQSPSYQIQQLIMSRNPVAGQNVNITLQNVGQVVAGNQQITLTSLPITNPASPGFQFSSQPRRFEHGSPSYIQVTSPISQQVQTQSPTQPNAVPIQALQGVRATTAGASLGMCNQATTPGFVDAGLLVRQLSLGPSSTGHFVFQEGSGITQIAPGAQVHLPSGTSTPVQTHTLLHSNSQTVGPVHQFGSQNTVATGAGMQTLATAGHITTTNIPTQISSIIQGQLIQHQQVLHGQQLGKTISFDRTSGGMIAGVAGASAFGISQQTPTSPSRTAAPQGLSSLPLTPTMSSTVKKQVKKLEEIPPATAEDARLRKQCLEHHYKAMKMLKENFKDYLTELFFLQHCQGNMMDFLAFRKKPPIQLHNFLRQNDLDLELEEEVEEKSPVVLTMQSLDDPTSPLSEISSAMEIQASHVQKESSTDSSQLLDSIKSDPGSQSPIVTHLVTQQHQPTPGKIGSFCATFGVPPSHQSAPLANRQNQPTKVPLVPNTASLQSGSRTAAPRTPVSTLPTTIHLTQQPHSDSVKGKPQAFGTPSLQSSQSQNSHPPQEKLLGQSSSLKTPSQLVSSKLGSDAGKSIVPTPSSPSMPPCIPDSLLPPVNGSPKRMLSPGASKVLSPSSSKSPLHSGVQDSLAQVTEDTQQEVSRPLEQENSVHQRITELRKEGLWSLRRLPKLMEPSRPKSHWDYLLEEMQWMAADFAQERMWKIACAKKMARTAARHLLEREQIDARVKKEAEDRLRRIAWFAAQEIQHFWSNIQQVVTIKLQVHLQQKRRKVFHSPHEPQKGQEVKKEKMVKVEKCLDSAALGTIVKPKDCDPNVDYTQKQVVLIDALLTVDGGNSAHMGARKNSRDIAEVAAAAELLLPRGSSRISGTVKTSLPPLLHGILRDYQMIGLDWLARQYKKNLNGILADEAGLGKNVQVIALLAHLASSEGMWGPHLIVVRSCNVLKWELELKRWCPSLKLLLYFGSQRELRRKRQRWEEPNHFHVCITSYKQLFKGLQAFMKMRWKYLILDEVHQLRNVTEKHWEAILNLPSQRRLLLRDTPLPHTWKDLWTMVHFLIPGLSRQYLDFPVKEGREQDQEYRHTISIRLHRSAQPFILRRTKRDVERQLNKKSEHVLKCQLSNRQNTMYEDVMMQPGTQDSLKGGHFVSVLHVLTQLQRICNHPDLVDPRIGHSSYACEALQYRTASLVLQALEYNPWKNTDLSQFSLIGLENIMTRYEAQQLPKKKVSRKLLQEIYSHPDPAPRPKPNKIKPSRLFEPVLYGQKPEGRMVALPSAPTTRLVTTTTATVTQQGQVKRTPVTTAAAPQGTKATTTQGQTTHVTLGAPRPQAPTTFSATTAVRQLTHSQTSQHTVQQSVLSPRLVLSSQARLPSGEVVKIAQLASGASQGRVAQPETPVTLQFQGNKFTLSQSQLRQLTAGQPLQLQGNVLQIVSAPGQYLRPQGSVVLPTVPQGATGNVMRTQPQVGASQLNTLSSAAPVTAKTAQTAVESVTRLAPAVHPNAQDSTEDRQRLLKERLDRIFICNERRCGRAPMYGLDLLSLFTFKSSDMHLLNRDTHWRWSGSVNCAVSSQSSESSNDLLKHLILSPEQKKLALQPVVKRTLCVIPTVIVPPPILMVPHPPPVYTHNMKMLSLRLRAHASPYMQDLREKTIPHCVQTPDLRLIQCDSGKLEALAILLRKLNSEGRRVLIFSQMLLMLDILETFLDLNSFTFLRIDEYANYEQCQDLMKSFNRDPRIFCMVLSTHIHSLGVYHIEADTVIFYDSDLNPVMDGKTQSWCDLIGRAKDIHVYRLVSANSIEEKLLRNGTKDLIREVAAQGSDYSLAFLTQQTIQELFEVSSPLEDTGFRVKAEEFVLLSQEPSPSDIITPKVAKPFVEALGNIEFGQEEEVMECIAQDDPKQNAGVFPTTESECMECEEPSQMKELSDLMQQLTPIEKYAVHYLEIYYAHSVDQPGSLQDELSVARKEWNLSHLKELNERMQWEDEENEELITYTREDAYNMDFIYDGPDGETEIMPIWTPPTPPQDENDIYIDSVMCLMYDTNPIPESKLPPVYVRKERKRHKTDPAAAGRKKKMRHGEAVVPPRSLFDRAVPNPLKVRKEGKEQKKNILLKQQTQFAKPLPTLIKPVMETGPDNPEWLISEDWALLQAVKQLLELPLNLSVVSPAHTPNWDLVSDVVNSCSRIYRSSKQCRTRYENVIIPREEGKLLYEASPKKKSENLLKNKPLRTNQIYAQDEGLSHSQLYTTRFELMKMTAGKRSPPIKPLLGMNPFQKNPKHASVLAESGINYDKPLQPIQVASQRADRIAKEKKALEQVRAQQQSGPLQQQPQQNGQQVAQPPPAQPVTVQTPAPAVTQAQVVVQQQPAAKGLNTSTASITTPALLTGTIKAAVPGTTIATGTVTANVLVNTVSGVPGVSPATFQPINKRLVSPVVTGTVSTTGGATAQVVQQRTATTPTAPTEMVTIATSTGVRAVTAGTVSTNLTPVQTQSRAIVTQVTTGTTTGVPLAGKTITPAQFQLLRQQHTAQQVQVSQIQAQASPGQIKAVTKISQEQLLKLQKQKLQLPQQVAQTGTLAGTTAQVQVQPQQTQQLATVTSRAGAVLTGATVTNLRLLQAQGQIQAQPGQTAQVALAKPPVVSAVVSSGGVTTLPVTVAGISVSINQPQKAAGGQTVMAQPLHMQPLLKLKHHTTQSQQQQKTLQTQTTLGQQKPYLSLQITTPQVSTASQQQKVTYTNQPAIKTQFLTTSLTQAQKAPGTQQVQAQIQVAKLPQVVQQQAAIATLQQVVSASQQVQPQTVTLTQATAAGPQQVQVIPAGTAAAHVVQQKLLQQQVMAAAASPQLQASASQGTAPVSVAADAQNQQAKLQVRTQTVRIKAPTKPS